MLVISKRYYKTASIKETPSGRCGHLSLASNPNLPLNHSIRKAFFIMEISKRMIDITGQRFGRLVVQFYSHKNTKANLYYWHCACDCGGSKAVSSMCLKNGTTKSCGCIIKEFNTNTKTVHGLCAGGNYPTEMHSWAMMKQRCYNEKDAAFVNYGGRGIIVCNWWLNSFKNFLEDMGYKPVGVEEYSVDRIDNDANYSCGHCQHCIENGWKFNCRWATDTEQNRGKRSNVWYEFKGEKILQSHLLSKIGISRDVLLKGLAKGFTIEQIAEQPRNLPSPRLTENKVFEVRKMKMDGTKRIDIAKITGLSIHSVKRILSYKTYKNILPKS